MSSRQRILSNLQKSSQASHLPSKWQYARHFDDLIAKYIEMVEKVQGQAYYLPDQEAALEMLVSLLQELGVKRAALNQQPPLYVADLKTRMPSIEWFVAGESGGSLRDFCTSADVGVTGAQAALAETGTLVITSGPGLSRMVSLLPPVHVAMLPSSRLLPDIFAWQENRRGSSWPANLVFVSGPSKTADIEQTMSVGVHGPKRFMVLIYDQD